MEKQPEKQRPALLTAFLGFMIAFNIIQISMAWTAIENTQFVHPNGTKIAVLIIKNLTYIVCCVALIKWRRWGFWGICLIGVFVFGSDLLVEKHTWGFVEYVIEVGILFFLLKFGGAQNAWDQLL